MENVHSYEINVTWKTGTNGTITSPVLDQPIEVASPPEFDGGIENIWSPEHLFVASVSSCLMTTFVAISKYSKFEYLSFSIKAKGTLEKVDGKFMMSEIELYPIVEISDKSKEAKALRILEKSDRACLISNSIKSKITLSPKVIVREPEMEANK